MTAEMLPLENVLLYSDGDEHGWAVEFAHLREVHSDKLAALRADMQLNGIREPIVIGPDGRVWDGHHRLCIADELGMTTIPVRFDEG